MSKLSKDEVHYHLSRDEGLLIIAECADALGVDISRREFRRRFLREIIKQGLVESEYFPESGSFEIRVAIPVDAWRDAREISRDRVQLHNLTKFRSLVLVGQRGRAV